jgi:hypothetical protein
MAVVFPQAPQAIDGSRGDASLEKERQHVTPDAVRGPRRVDALVTVWRNGGEAAWVLAHVAVQGQEAAGGAERMSG